MSRWRAWRRRLVWTFGTLALLPWVLALGCRVVQPPATPIQLSRAVQRALDGKQPWWPVRRVVSRSEIAPALRRAVLAAEDARFYTHRGFDLVEIEAAIERKQRGGRLRGASTISQQVAKNLFLWEGRSFVRKGLEAYCTVALEVVVPKDRILDLYLNLAEWGDGYFGAEAAAQHWFKVPASRLSEDQAARLAAILPAPRRWSPTGSVAARRTGFIRPRMRQVSAYEPTERPTP
ncbi:MAG: monofunctional biosynthetic peptidoglycan transglycosylase [Gemmatimonadaceae bacterium]|nr:monofunctional biosynthetic peptidoglycan transglycosylase [Gemmatimonadaceae bacterium]